jgi:peptidoglycan/LPS O-acetylase OafA/YrhL
MARRRLDQVDAMRPIKQAGVVSTHSIIYFAPAAAGVSTNAVLLLLHVSRDGFFFLSACMLTYAYAEMRLTGLRRFYWRRFVSVGIPYLCWNVIYFLRGLPGSTYASPAAALAHLGRLIDTGYYQLYFLLVIMQFYLVFPLVLMLLRRTRGHHGLVLAVAAAAQVTISIMTHWNMLPTLMVRYAQQDALTYLLYLIGGAIVAFHIEEVDAWVRRNAHLIMALTLIAAIGAESVYYLALHGVTTVLGSGSDPFQPSVIPFDIGAITCGYLAGVALVQPWRSRRTKALVRVGSDDSYGIYLSQMLFVIVLTSLGWGRLNSVLPWPLVCLLTVVTIFACCIALTGLLARTPLAVPLTGRKQAPWSTLIPGRRPVERTPQEQACTDQAPAGQALTADQPQPEPDNERIMT